MEIPLTISDQSTVYLLNWTTRNRLTFTEWPYRMLELVMGRYFTHMSTLIMPRDWTLAVRGNQLVIKDAEGINLTPDHPMIEKFYYETHPFYGMSAWDNWLRDRDAYANLRNKRLKADDIVMEAFEMGTVAEDEVMEFYARPENRKYRAKCMKPALWHKLTREGKFKPKHIRMGLRTPAALETFMHTLRSRGVRLTDEEEEFLSEFREDLKIGDRERGAFSATSYNCAQKCTQHIHGLLGDGRSPLALKEYVENETIIPAYFLKKLVRDGHPLRYSVQTSKTRELMVLEGQGLSELRMRRLYWFVFGVFKE